MKKVFLLLVLLLLFLPLIQQVYHPINEKPLLEKRRLSGLPQFTLNNLIAYPAQFERYYTDQFGLRSTLIRVNSFIRIELLKQVYVNGVIIGKNGWLFLDEGIGARYPKVMSQEAFEQYKKEKNERALALKKLNIPYLHILVPDKNSVYLDYLPFFNSKHISTSKLFIKNEMNLVSEFKKNNLFPLYYKTDSHWTSYGSYIAYRKIINSLHITPYEIDMTSTYLEESPGGDLTHLVAQTGSDNNIVIGLKPPSTGNNKYLDTVVIYYDSFFDPQYSWSPIPYFKHHFKNIILIKNSTPVDINYLQKIHPNLVIYEMVERFVAKK